MQISSCIDITELRFQFSGAKSRLHFLLASSNPLSNSLQSSFHISLSSATNFLDVKSDVIEVKPGTKTLIKAEPVQYITSQDFRFLPVQVTKHSSSTFMKHQTILRVSGVVERMSNSYPEGTGSIPDLNQVQPSLKSWTKIHWKPDSSKLQGSGTRRKSEMT